MAPQDKKLEIVRQPPFLYTGGWRFFFARYSSHKGSKTWRINQATFGESILNGN